VTGFTFVSLRLVIPGLCFRSVFRRAHSGVVTPEYLMQTGTRTDTEQGPKQGGPPPRAKPSPPAPTADATAADLAASAGDGPESDPRFQATRNATIMIVDDEPIIVEILRSVLEDAGYASFIECSDSSIALQLLSDNKPDLVLLDVNMPGVTGLDIINGIRADEALKHIPAIVLTGATDSATKLIALGLGATDVLGKPVDPSELALRVRNTLTAKAHQDRLLNFDALTGLPNRRLFMERYTNALAVAGEKSGQCALLLLGLDRFQKINDSQGTEIGDALLTAFAAALDEHIRESDLPGISGVDEETIALSRVDGDEFAMIIPNLPHGEISDLLCRRILSMLEKPFHVSGQELRVTASIGITIYPADGETTDTLFANAGAAMAAAKKSGGNSYHHHSTEQNEKSMERQELEAQLQLAPVRGELFLSIQPKLEVQSGRVSGAEGTLRWKHGTWGIVAPEKFLPIAEETGLIIPAGEQALSLACALNKKWQTSGIEAVRVSVDVSGRQFRSLENLANAVRRVLEKTGLEGKFLTLKFPEPVLMENPERNVSVLKELKNLGVRLCLDQFGTGLSSMGYLRHFSLDEIKIDGSLIKDVPGNKDAAAVVVAAIKLAQGMGLTIIAEGVESEDQLTFLKKWGCDEFQGKLSMAQSTDWQKSVRKAANARDSKRKSA
jgi:diguanylate cyclase (GGDEF)-like protein